MSAQSTSPFVLIVEDDPAICELLDLLLVDAGYDVSSVGNAKAAFALVQARQPDVILLDLSLPETDGPQFAKAYRSLPGATALIVAMSGHPSVQRLARELDAAAAVAKPFEIDALLQTLHDLLAARAAIVEGILSPDDDPTRVACCRP